ncbi:MAG: hypothetical protein A2Y67_03715 [Candidatus Buchananbacteria bacterium RBG_13_39_9]|jgi:predicted RNA-binding protein YlqC (UPF0109 family)|uniref:Uncharacterized protein n=1 Tax=Candidatus Buchananbacteria bacterium RBG_13_39_9 TaxID=1797531 RepID=A0A1G1XRV1_9BACT|nr:MAG: hypothetical protein A2Y67_03715 [Candidatus Buchananbacteria bacterium RBG_13_39_9]
MDKDKKFLEDLLEMLVSQPKKVKVKRLVNDKGVLLTIDVALEDLGTVIGKQGGNISAIRHLVRMIGLQNKAFVSIKLNQPERK